MTLALDAETVRRWMEQAAADVVAVADRLDRLDAVAGDGDHGRAMARGFGAAARVLAADPSGSDGAGSVDDALTRAGSALAEAAGGTAGALLGAALAAMGSTRGDLEAMLRAAVDAMAEHGRAVPGDKTMLDALAPAAAVARVGVQAASGAAWDGALATANVAARVGRARNVAGGGTGSVDPGAVTVAVLIGALATVTSGPARGAVLGDGIVGGTGDGTGGTGGTGASGPAAGGTGSDDSGTDPDDSGAGGPEADPPGPSRGPGRKLHNDTDAFVDEMLDGLIAAHSERLVRGRHHRVIRRRRSKDAGRVALVIGNGSGHEPIAVGWVGPGLLDANAVGDVFAAPPASLLADAIVESDRGGGVLVLVSRHDGDVLAAEEATNRARAAGVSCEQLWMYDDVTTAPPGRRHDRRGAPGTTFLYKVLGAAAEEGRSLADLVDLGRRLRDRTSTIGVSTGSGVSPTTGRPMHDVPEGRVVVGTGVHGEGGAWDRDLGRVDDLVAELVDFLVADLAATAPGPEDDEVLVLVNGAGATSLGELWVVYREVDRRLRRAGLVPFHPVVGELVTTQDSSGFSISVARTDAEVRRLWTAPADAPYFPAVGER